MTEIDLTAQEILTAIEFSVEQRMNLESDEQVTIITHPLTIKAIKIAIAQGKIFQKIYPRLIFSPDENLKLSDLIIIPDHIIEEVVQDDLRKELEDNEEVKEKMKLLNEKMSKIPEEQLIKLSQTPEEQLTKEELALKNELQFAMLEVGMNIDLQFDTKDKRDTKQEQLLNKLLEANKIQRVGLEGINNGQEK